MYINQVYFIYFFYAAVNVFVISMVEIIKRRVCMFVQMLI